MEEKIAELEEANRDYIQGLVEVDRRINIIIVKVGTTVDLSDCDGDIGKLLKKIDAVETCVDAKDWVSTLKDLVLKMKPDVENETTNEDEETVGIDRDMKSCKSLEDIINKFSVFEYSDLEGGVVNCLVCSRKVSVYRTELNNNFHSTPMSQSFRSLKTCLKFHLKTEDHVKASTEARAVEKQDEKEELRNRRIGLILGTLAYYLLKLGRPHTDFVVLVAILAKCGVDVGELNHSKEFVAAWKLSCAEVIQRRLRKFFSTRLPQTGQLPPVKVILPSISRLPTGFNSHEEEFNVSTDNLSVF